MNNEDKELRVSITFWALVFVFSSIVVSGSIENIDFERVLEALPMLG